MVLCVSDGSHHHLRQSRTSLSVLSPFDEQEEWLKILEILSTCNSGIGSGPNGDESNLLGDVQRELQNRLGKSDDSVFLPSIITFYLEISFLAQSTGSIGFCAICFLKKKN